MVPAYWVCGKKLRKGTMVSISTSAWKKAAPPVLTLILNNSVLPHMPLVTFELLRSSEGMHLS